MYVQHPPVSLAVVAVGGDFGQRLAQELLWINIGKVGLAKLISALLVVVMARVRVVFKVLPTVSPGLGNLPQPGLVDLADGVFR
jgi:hypothetical protein